MEQNQTQRRRFLKLGGAALALVPAAMIPAPAGAAQNAAVRASLKYQSKPEGDKSCSNCVQFVPGPTPKDAGGCKVLPGDTEVSPQAYCIAWAKKP
jgi:hypothetical protein